MMETKPPSNQRLKEDNSSLVEEEKVIQANEESEMQSIYSHAAQESAFRKIGEKRPQVPKKRMRPNRKRRRIEVQDENDQPGEMLLGLQKGDKILPTKRQRPEEHKVSLQNAEMNSQEAEESKVSPVEMPWQEKDEENNHSASMRGRRVKNDQSQPWFFDGMFLEELHSHLAQKFYSDINSCVDKILTHDKKRKDTQKVTHICFSYPMQDEGYACDICGKEFPTKQAKGGHTSRKHKGESKKYQAQLETRKKYEERRLGMQAAKNIKKELEDAGTEVNRRSYALISKLVKEAVKEIIPHFGSDISTKNMKDLVEYSVSEQAKLSTHQS